MLNGNFWKKIIVFSMTFLAGTLISDFYANYKQTETTNISSEELTVNNFLSNFSQSKRKDCISEDETLKYRRIPLNKADKNAESQTLPYFDEGFSVDIDRLLGLNVQLADIEAELEKLDNSDTKKVNELQRQKKVVEAEIDRSLKITGKSSFNDEFHSDTEKLVHLEKCLESSRRF